MAGLVGSGGPPALIAFPCLVIYIKLMKQITSRPMANGLDIDNDKEKVIQRTIALLTKFFVLCLDIPQEDKLDDHRGGDTMTLIIILSVIGVTCTLTYMGPFLWIHMTTPLMLNINYLVQILICMVETDETILGQVIIDKTKKKDD